MYMKPCETILRLCSYLISEPNILWLFDGKKGSLLKLYPTCHPHFMVTAWILFAELLPLPPDLGDLVERRIANGEWKAAFGQAQMKKVKNCRWKNDGLVAVVNDPDLFGQIIALHVGHGNLEVRQVGLCADHGPAKALGRHWAKVDSAAGADVKTWSNQPEVKSDLRRGLSSVMGDIRNLISWYGVMCNVYPQNHIADIGDINISIILTKITA